MVRESHSLGQCTLLGELIDETCTRYFYRRRYGDTLALVDKTIADNSRRTLQDLPGLLLIISRLAQVQACGEARGRGMWR